MATNDPSKAATEKMTKAPATLYVKMRAALRKVVQDSRDGKPLQSDTVKLVDEAVDELNAWQDKKAAG